MRTFTARPLLRAVLTAVMTAVLAGPAAAQTPASDALLLCAGTVADAERLACYDRVVAGMSARAGAIAGQRTAAGAEQRAADAAAAAAAVAATQARAAEQKQAQFGRESMRDPPPPDVPAAESLEATVTEVFTDAGRRLVFLLDNGQVWRQAGTAFAVPPKAGTVVVVKRGSFGSFRLLVPARNQVIQVVRVR